MPKNPLAEVFGYPVDNMTQDAINHRHGSCVLSTTRQELIAQRVVLQIRSASVQFLKETRLLPLALCAFVKIFR